MKKLIIVGHPWYEKSIHIKGFIEIVKESAKNTDVHILPYDGQFNVEEEQKRLLNYDVIAFAYPIWWYTYPWNLKKWFDEVLTPGFGFSFRGKIEEFKLKDKKFLIIESIGNTEETYNEGKPNMANLDTLNLPLYGLTHLLATGWPANGEIKTNKTDEFMLKPIYMYGSSISDNKNWEEAAKKYLKEID